MFRRMRINTQERAVSSDINRLQSFAIKGTTELWRHLLLIATSESNLATYTEAVTLTTPLTAEILRGLRVIPELATLNLAVGSGIVAMIDPSQAGADDSSAVLIQSDGVSTPGALVMTANASGSVRIDVIECRQNAIPDLTTDNRDIFDASTGLFTATSVTKEIEPQLEFRVRAGTPGAGFPGTASGWLPLCVAYVPNGATNNDAITFWDVRPLVEDRASGPIDLDTRTELLSLDAHWSRVSAGSWVVNGISRSRFKGRNVGGIFRRGSPGTDADSVDFAVDKTATVTEAGSSSRPYYAYFAFPFGLPRWSRYTDASSGSRVPREPKGIPIFTDISPDVYGNPSSAIPLDTVGFAGATTSDACFCFYQHGGSSQFREAWFRNKVFYTTSNSQVTLAVSSVVSTTIARFNLDPTTRPLPPNAKTILLQATAFPSIPAGDWFVVPFHLKAYYDGSTSNPTVQVSGGVATFANPTGAPANVSLTSPTIRVPFTPKIPGTPTTPHIIDWDTDSATLAAIATLSFQGFEF